MALPNYAPTGTVLLGSVPWDNGYSNVRLYTSLSAQQSDIQSMMGASTDGYTYIARNRRLKVSIPADRLYHVNYCMYRNASVTDGWIYCFVTDVQYVNDNTTELQLETDVFQTYLYNVDWQIPACFIERETVPSESSKYLFTNEPDFPLVYTIDDSSDVQFDCAGFIVMSCADPEQNDSLIDDILNPGGWYANPINPKVIKGISQGCNFYYCPVDTTSGGSESLERFLHGINAAGSVESVVAIFSIPSWAASGLSSGFQEGNTRQDQNSAVQMTIQAPDKGTSLDGYAPHNQKMFYYPYCFLNVTDMNGSSTELRYELLGNRSIEVKYAPSPACKALVYPDQYMGASSNYDAGIVVPCGALGSWSNAAFSNWLAQNSGTLTLNLAATAIAGVAGAVGIASVAKNLVPALVNAGASGLSSAQAMGAAIGGLGAASTLGNALQQSANQAAQLQNASKQPNTIRGQADMNQLYATGAQGVHVQKKCVNSEIAQLVDGFFDRFGYEVDDIEAVNITSRPAWNYVKTVGAAPKSLNVTAGSSAPFTRGRGTPASALSVIREAFDRGVTFWHSTSNFGDFSQDNSL